MNLDQTLEAFKKTRSETDFLCETLEIEDFVVQPIVDVSPLKWHLAHTTWFFENFILVPFSEEYKLYNDAYPYLFNSYYIGAGDRWLRANRGQLTRPTVQEILDYRDHVDSAMVSLLVNDPESFDKISKWTVLGINHEQQHQELLLYDVKRILGDNPLFPIYRKGPEKLPNEISVKKWLKIDEGIYDIGYDGEAFHFDNEEGKHSVFLHEFAISSALVTNGEYLEFIENAGYGNHKFWLSEGWDWVNKENIEAPRYWHKEGDGWCNYTLSGYEAVDLDEPLCHISYYEADAFARWKGYRLPTEQEWEVACRLYSPSIPETANLLEERHFRPTKTDNYDFLGNLWEWTSSAYAPYPYYKVPDGAVGEYNGKFMINQMVLRGGSFATSRDHIRPTYRNFFHPNLRWLFCGFRLAKHTQ